MTYAHTSKQRFSNPTGWSRVPDFNARIEEGIRRAPEERAKAIREFWNWFTARG